MRTRTLVAALLAASIAACGRSAPIDPAQWSVTPQPVASPAGPNSSEPQITASDRGVILSWIERTGTTAHLKFAERAASGWSAPVEVASGTDWFVSYADPPAVMRLSNGTLVAQWERQTDPFVEAMDLVLVSSTDNGKSWSRPFTPHHDGTKSQHAFASLFELAGSTLGLVWLDGRESMAETDDPAGGSMMMRYAAFDAGWKQIADAQVDARVCECCQTSVAMTSDGPLTAYRDRSAQEIRDIAVTRLEDGQWTGASSVHNDGYKTYACPVNGPAITARDRRAAVAWYTVKGEQGQAFVAFSDDAGRTWGAAHRLDQAGSLGRVDVEMLDDGSAVATFVEFADNRAQLRMRRIDPSGAMSPAISLAGVGTGRASGFPRMARQGDELVFAWSESTGGADDSEASLSVKTAIARLPRR